MGLNKKPLSVTANADSSDFLRAQDLPEEGLEATISKVGMESVGFDEAKKVVVHFEETGKGLVLNKTNWKIIERLTGEPELENWKGTKITLYKSEIVWQGTPTPCIRVMQKLKNVSKF